VGATGSWSTGAFGVRGVDTGCDDCFDATGAAEAGYSRVAGGES